jgi:RNA polymerase sigma factor (sigma-70 family)
MLSCNPAPGTVGPTLSLPVSPVDASHQDHAKWFTEEVQPHEVHLRSWIRMKFPSLCDLDDIVQEAYLRIWRKRSSGAVRSPKGFLYTAAHNAACDFYRRQHAEVIERGNEPALLASPETAPDAAELAALHFEQEACAAALLALPEKMRQVFTLRKIFGLSQRQIAEQLGIAEHTVEAHIGEGSRRCMKFLRARGINRP